MIDFKLKRFSKPKHTELPNALPLGPPPGLYLEPTGGLTALCRPPADFFLSSAQELNLEHKNGGMTKCLETGVFF